MCGICGIIDLSGNTGDIAGRLPNMVAVLHHRGPDQVGAWADDRAALGHTRLSIIDVTDGRQPLSNEDGTVWIAYNGELYNFQPLREELKEKGHRFRTRTDTEVIVHLFEEEGIRCVDRLRGMFAFAIWDSRAKTAYLVRDQIGIKPLFYCMQGGRLIFGSEIKAILAHGDIPRTVREDALSDYLAFQYVPGPKTMFRDIFKLEAGTWLRLNAQGMHKETYWDIPPRSSQQGDRARTEKELVAALAESVKMQLVSDVPLGAFLSGGVDSSAIVAMMSLAGQDPLITICAGFNEKRYDESPFARRVAERYRTHHVEEVVQPEATRIVETLSWHYDEPFADYSAVPTYYVSKAARQHVKVALSGDGGDENLAGYRRHRLELFERRIRQMLPTWFRKGIIGPLARVYPKADWLPRPLRAKVTLEAIAADRETAYCRSVGFLSECEKAAFFTGDCGRILKDYRSVDIIRSWMKKGNRNGLDEILYTDAKMFLVDDILTKVDRASMAVSLEVRPPILDHRFVEFMHQIPPSMKIEGSQGKAVFKSAMRPYLDQETLYRPKQGFELPLSQWMRGPLREMVGDLLLGPHVAYGDYIDRSTVDHVWRAHQSGIGEFAAVLWSLLMLELWLRKFVVGEVVGSSVTNPVVIQRHRPE